MSDVCPDCLRMKAHSADDCCKGYCSKWYAIRDEECAAECRELAQLHSTEPDLSVEVNRYVEFNDDLRRKLAEKTQQNLDLARKVSERDKVIKALHDLFTAQHDLHLRIENAVQMFDHYERTR